MIRDMTRDDLKAALAADAVTLVDVREPHEFAAGHIPGAISMPLSRFDPHELPADGGRTLVFVCAAGIRSIHAIEAARSADVDVDVHYAGGFKDWVMAGEAIETGD